MTWRLSAYFPRSNDKGLSSSVCKVAPHIVWCMVWAQLWAPDHLIKKGGGRVHMHGDGSTISKWGWGGALWCTCSYFCPSYQYLKMHCNMGKFCFLSAMCFMSPISGDPFKSKYFARGPSTHKSLTFRLNKTFSFWNDLSAFVLLLLLLVKARKVLFQFISSFLFGKGITKLVRNSSFS